MPNLTKAQLQVALDNARVVNLDLAERINRIEQAARAYGATSAANVAIASTPSTAPKLSTTVTEAIASKTDASVWMAQRLGETRGRPGAYIRSYVAEYDAIASTTPFGDPASAEQVYAAWRKFKTEYDGVNRAKLAEGVKFKSLLDLTTDASGARGAIDGKAAAIASTVANLSTAASQPATLQAIASNNAVPPFRPREQTDDAADAFSEFVAFRQWKAAGSPVRA